MQALSLFTGAMGLDIGLEHHGFKTVVAVEHDKHAQATIKTNRPDVIVMDDVFSVSTQELASLGPFDAIFGGPPCQSWSYAGNRQGLNDHRGLCIPRFLEIVHELLPQFVVMENVQGLLSASVNGEKAAVVRMILDSLKNDGYLTSMTLANAADYGSPQCRHRIVIMASHSPTYLLQTHVKEDGILNNLPLWLTLRDAIGDIKDNPGPGATYRQSQLKYLELLKAGQDWRNLPQHLQAEAMGGAINGDGGRTSYFRRLSWDKPAPTLVCCPTQKSTCLCHPDQTRPLSVKEYARIQGFPDNWKFTGPISAQYRQIGNAVPVQLATAIGKALNAVQ